ncbi:hypothetical protein DNTS_030438, partial [Danionella cerebrum]
MNHFIGELNVGVAVAESRHICHLCIRELQEPSPVLVLHLHNVKDALYALDKENPNEVRQLFEVRVFGPHGLRDHLSQFHGCQRWTQPAVAGEHIHTCLDQTHGLHNQMTGASSPKTPLQRLGNDLSIKMVMQTVVQRRDKISHLSGVLMMMSPLPSSFREKLQCAQDPSCAVPKGDRRSGHRGRRRIEWGSSTFAHRDLRLTHPPVLAQNLDEVKSVETQKQHQLVLTLSVITGSLTNQMRVNTPSTESEHTITSCKLIVDMTILYLKDLQDLICFLLGHDGIVVEATELSLKPESINISRGAALISFFSFTVIRPFFPNFSILVLITLLQLLRFGSLAPVSHLGPLQLTDERQHFTGGFISAGPVDQRSVRLQHQFSINAKRSKHARRFQNVAWCDFLFRVARSSVEWKEMLP